MAQRLQGWLQVADKATLDAQRELSARKNRRLGRRKYKTREDPPTVWRSYFCILQVSDRTLRHSLSERRGSQTRGRTLNDLRLRLERGRRGTLSQLDGQSSPSPVTEEDDSELSETTSLRDDKLLKSTSAPSSTCSNPVLIPSVGPSDQCPKRHTTLGFVTIPDIGSASPTGSSHEQSPVGTPTKPMDTPSRFANFFSKRSLRNVALKRTKSVTKLERKRCALDADVITPSQLRSSRSHESLLQSSPSVLGTVDLSAGEIKVSSVHNSLLDQNYCFQLSSRDGTTYYSCQSNQEKEKWIRNLQQTIDPERDQQRRVEKSLNIWLLEAKGISSKKKYFCELCLDKTLYARTSSKLKNDLCFWGEHFEFNNLPHLENISVNLYREADKKKRRDKNILIGSTVIHVNSLSSQHITEKWYPVFPEKSSSSKECPSLRIKSRFLNLTILPFEVYSDFLQYLKTEYKTMCELLEPAISVRTKEDIATSLIYIMEKENMAKKFLTDIVMAEIEKIEDHRLLFRGNSTATKAIEAYMKLIGEKYLQDTLGEVVNSLMTLSTEDCEVDPIKVTSNSQILHQQSNLISYVEMVWSRITASASSFPTELREIFSECRQQLAEKGKEEELCDNLISASVFLRFLCPAILSPSLFNLSHEYPQGKTARKLTLIAKSIQTFANFTRFGGKESFMEFMNEFLEREWSSMKTFLKEISSPVMSQPQVSTEFDGHIDEGRELAILHNLLVDSVARITDKSVELEVLQNVLDGISAALSQPALQRHMSSPVPPSPSTVERLALAALPENSVPQRSATMPRTYPLGSGQQPASDLNTSDDYVLLSALDTQQSLPNPQASVSSQSVNTKGDGGIPFHSQNVTKHIHQPISASQEASRLQSVRRSFNLTPNRASTNDELRYTRRRLWKHNEDSNENADPKLCQFTSLPGRQFSSHHSTTYSPTDSLSTKSAADSPRLAPPLAFNNPMYQHRTSSHAAKNHTSPLSSFSSESDEDIAVIRRNYLGSAESEPALAIGSRYCCTSSSSTDTNSCESPPVHHSKLKSSSKFATDNYQLLNHPNKAQPMRSSSDTCSFEPKPQQVHRSSTDSGLHKSFRSTLKSCHHTEYPSCAAQDRKTDSKLRRLYSKATIEEYERQVRELRTLMGQLQSKLQEAEVKLNCQEDKTEAAITEWKKHMEEEDEKIKKQQNEKDQQMKSIITRLITVEEELRKEQREMQVLLADKQRIIEAQERKIVTLDATNTHLLAVLSQLRGQYPLRGQNGSTPPLKNTFVHRDPLFKSSSC